MNEATRPPGRRPRPRQAASQSASGAAIKLAGENVHRQEEDEATEPGPGEVGEIDAPEGSVALEEDAAQKDRAGQEGRQLRQENRQKLPLLRGSETRKIALKPSCWT